MLKLLKKSITDIPILLTSNNSDNEEDAKKAGASFILKDSPILITRLQHFMNNNFGFGDFIFKTADGVEVGRANDLKSMEEQLKIVPMESIKYHAEKNHFSNWFKARTEFWLAHKLRPRKVSDYTTGEALRNDLLHSIHDYRMVRQRGIITDFNKETFDPESSFAELEAVLLVEKQEVLVLLTLL